jgi:glutamate-1-semialdehyde 2,1-aminomutase
LLPRNSVRIPGEVAIPRGTWVTLAIQPDQEDQARRGKANVHTISLRGLFERFPRQVAAVIVEPVGGNAGCIPPLAGFLEGLRDLCTAYEAVLIFDEVMTGFRVAPGGASERYGVVPDLYTFGKVIGGGMPIGAYAGGRALMSRVAPAGPVYQAGTLSGNPVAVAAGLTTLQQLVPASYERLEALGARLESRLAAAIGEHGWPLALQRVGSMFSLFFTAGPVERVQDAAGADLRRFGAFFHGMLERGFYLAPSAFECGFLSLSHDEALIDETADAMIDVLKSLYPDN